MYVCMYVCMYVYNICKYFKNCFIWLPDSFSNIKIVNKVLLYSCVYLR